MRSAAPEGRAAALAALLLAAPAAARALEWSVAGDTSAFVGAEARLVYRVSLPAGAKLEPDALASATTDFAVVEAKGLPDGSWAWTVLPLDEGRLSFAARWTLDGKPVEAPPAVLAVRVPDLPKDADIVDIKGPLAARRALWPWLLAAALLAAAYAGRRWWKSRVRPGEAAAPAEPPLPPEVRADREIAALRASGLWDRGEHAAYYLQLTEILRRYLEGRYGAPATAMTSPEVARLVKERADDLKISATVRELLSRADLVKFARLKAGPDEGPRDAEMVLAVVRATTPQEPAPEGEPA